MKCEKCGATLRQGVKFCPKCGQKVNVKEEEVKKEVKEVKAEVVTNEKPENNNTVSADKNNIPALVGFILSIVSMCCCCGAFSGIALILSIVGLIQINSGNGKGKGFAIAGIAIAGVGVLMLIILSAMGEMGEIISKLDSLTIMFR